MTFLAHPIWTATGILATSLTIMTALMPVATTLPTTAAHTPAAAIISTGDTSPTVTTPTAPGTPVRVTTAAAQSKFTVTTGTTSPNLSTSRPGRHKPNPASIVAPAPVPTATGTPTPQLTISPTPHPTATPMPIGNPTASATPTLTPVPSTAPTPKPTTSPTPSPTTSPTNNPNAMPTGNLTGWTQNYAQDFNQSAAIGKLGSIYGRNLNGYSGFNDTSGNGTYAPDQVLSAHDSMLDYYIHATNGKYLTAAPAPQGYTGQLYGKYTLRFRSDNIPNYKIAFLLWPDSGNWLDGELDFPEGELGQTIYGYAHNTTGTPQNNAFYINTGMNMNTWHTLSIEWTPTRLTYIIDGVAKTTTNAAAIPKKPMHLSLQAETDLDGTRPSTSAAGHLQIDWLTIYNYTP